MKKAALFFIGQSPRPDIFGELRPCIPERILLTQHGALDGLSGEALARLTPCSDDDLLITKLRSGEEVRVSETLVGKLLEEKMCAAAEDHDVCVLLCTGAFGGLDPGVPLITADKAFHEKMIFAESVRTLGVIVPLEAQREAFGRLFASYGKNVLTAAADPYGPQEVILAKARELRESGADVLCLDCMGYDGKTACAAAQATGLDVRIPRQETAKQILAFFDTKETIR